MTRDVYICGVGAYLPDQKITVAEAASQGSYDLERAQVDGFSAVRVEPVLSPPEMAVMAARSILVEDTTTDAGLNTIYFTSIHRHGHKHLWPAASYIHKQLGQPSQTRTVGINQGCNGAFIAASIAYEMLRAGIPGDHLVLGADRYNGSGFDRFNSDLGTLYGDAASAIRLGTTPGVLRIRYLGFESETRLEEMYRDAVPAPEGEIDHRIKEAKKAYLDRVGREHFNTLFLGALDRLRTALLAATDLSAKPARYVIYPNVGAGLSAKLYESKFGDLATRNMWSFGRSIGHTGTSDQFIGLWKLLSDQALNPGDKVLLLGAGNGLSLAALVLEVK